MADAYGWPITPSDADLLSRLVALNHVRAAEEKAGIVCYLRPSYQAPGQQQMLVTFSTDKKAITPEARIPQAWPVALADQMQGLPTS